MTGWLVLAIAAVAVAILTALAVVRVVPSGHTGLVSRAGRPRRCSAEGLVAVVPFLDRIDLVPHEPAPLHCWGLAATTWDGVQTRVSITACWRVVDVPRAVAAKAGAESATVEALERSLRRGVAHTTLADLLRDRQRIEAAVRDDADAFERVGTEILDVDVLDVEVRAGGELLRLLA